jgi:hypothetical protein
LKTRREFLHGTHALASAIQIAGQFSKPAFSKTNSRTAVEPEPQLASAPADSFVEFISVQTHLNWYNTVWDQAAWRPLLGGLGVRYTRSSVGNRLARDHLHALYQDYDIRSTALFNTINKDGSFKLDTTLETLAFMREEIGPEKIHAVEGPNEYTHKYKSEGWAERLIEYQKFLHDAVKSDAALNGAPVVAPTIWKRNLDEYNAIRGIDPYADFGNLHLYNGGRKPSMFDRDKADVPIDAAIRDAQIVTPGKPVCITETGFNVADGASPPKWAVPPEVAAKYTLRNLAELFLRRHLVKSANIYSLIDDEHENNHFGLLDTNLTPRPAYWALRNLVSLLSDPGLNFASEPLTCQIKTDDANLRSLVLQKRDKRFMLMLWLDVDSYDRRTAAAIDVPPCQVTVDFGWSVASLKAHTPTLADAKPKELTAVSSVTLAVPDHLMLVEITL